MILYDNPESSNALKVRVLLAELGLPYDRVEIGFDFPRPPHYVERQPSGTIPLLEDGPVRIGESNAILRYLARREGREDLYPADPVEAAAVDWALDLWSTEARPGVLDLEDVLVWGDPAPGDGELAAITRRAEEALDVFERFAGADGWTVLSRLTIADCAVAPVLWRSRRLPLDHARRPKLARIVESVTGRDAWAAAGPVK